MPTQALPIPPARPTPGAVTVLREYHDALGRPMSGEVTITGGKRSTDGQRVLVPAAVVAPVAGGVLRVALPPGTYTFSAALKTLDGGKASDVETVTVEAAS